MKTIHDFMQAKQQGRRFSMVTCYDYASALMVEASQVDCVLVGDSVAMVMHGASDTTQATMEMMEMHTAAVAKGLNSKWIVGDLPFMSYRKSLAEAMSSAERLMRSGAHSIKLEGAEGNEQIIQHMVASGVPVMGHLGLTPQHVHALGGFKVQAKTKQAGQLLLQQAQTLEQAGCYALVLECIPAALAAEVTATLSIPTIGIGAGAATDAQVLVWHDLLGLIPGFKPRFVKQFAQLHPNMVAGIDAFAVAVQNGVFPDAEHTYRGVVDASMA